jgi:serine/threonine protein phosphatase PrpC
MITCPECGQAASDDAKFCDRCGQGLSASSNSAPPLLIPLEPVVHLMSGQYQIIELLSQTSRENRYRIEDTTVSHERSFQLREQLGPSGEDEAPDFNDQLALAEPDKAEDPAGPHAKTAELKVRPQPVIANGGVPGNSPDLTQAEPERASTGADPEPPSADREIKDSPEGAVGELAEIHDQNTMTAPVELNQKAEANPEDNADLGETFGRVLALSMTLTHPAIERALNGFAENGRVYLVYHDEQLTPLSGRPGGLRMPENEALNVAIQVCQAVAFIHRRGMRVNDLCPESIAFAPDNRVRLTSLDYVSNDNELQSEPVFNDGYTAPEIYRGKRVDKRADIFSIGALLYTCLTGERLEAEGWREEAGPIRFYPPHVVAPALEQAVRRALSFDPAGRWANVDAFKTELLKIFGTIAIRAAALTDVGMVRELNEDSLLTVEYTRRSLLDPASGYLHVIADGMGGAEAGEVASAIAVASIRDYIQGQFDALKAPEIQTLLQAALEDANRKILEYTGAHPEARGMGSTAVATLIVPPDAAIAWVGDSRAYLSEPSGLKQISKDHSLVQRLIEIGQITPEEARHHEHKNVITRSLGARPRGPAGAEVTGLRLKRGDRIMLCSDGLTAHVTDEQLSEIIRRHTDPAEAARELVVAANAGGGTDNVSVVVIFAV